MKATTKTEIKEADLLKLLKAKDEKAFNYLYLNYSKSLLKGIHQLIPSKELAQDILHDAFIKVWLNVGKFDGEKASLYTWMSRIAQNTARDSFRSKENKLVAKCQELGESMQSVDNQHFTVIKTDDVGIINAVNKLSTDRQQIIDLYYYKGYTANEIAKQKGLPLGTVKTRIHVAITELRKMVA
jgi:RNA polymerase sigma-70 factor, ECF subfamily